MLALHAASMARHSFVARRERHHCDAQTSSGVSGPSLPASAIALPTVLFTALAPAATIEK
jgi:hypothetical protein